MTQDLRALAAHAASTSHAASDPDYPLIHLAPPVGRLNDPNGLLIDGDVAHAFFQYTPLHGDESHPKLVYWGHATSTDLVHWTHEEAAIVPDSPYDANGAYSGGAIVLDEAEAATAPAGARYQFFYTGNLRDEATGERTASQALVTSQDLRTFTKWPGNPVIATHEAGYTANYRDPQVTRDPRGGYRMLIGAQREDLTGALVLYRSTDLVTWTFEGEVTFPDAGGAMDDLGFMWECPNLVTLTDEVTGEERDVLIWCPQGAHPTDATGAPAPGYENIYPCVYAVGRLDGTQFLECDGTMTEVDRGFEFYAPQCFARPVGDDAAVIMLGWAGNASEDDQPSIISGNWVHCLTLPRRLSLRAGRLIQQPLLPDPPEEGRGAYVERPVRTSGDHPVEVPELAGSRTWWLAMRAGRGGEIGVRIGSPTCYVDVHLTTGENPELIVDRSSSRYETPDSDGDAGVVRHVAVPRGIQPRIEVVHDRSITEVYVGRGDLAFTFRSYVDPQASGASVWATAPASDGFIGLRTLD